MPLFRGMAPTCQSSSQEVLARRRGTGGVACSSGMVLLGATVTGGTTSGTTRDAGGASASRDASNSATCAAPTHPPPVASLATALLPPPPSTGRPRTGASLGGAYFADGGGPGATQYVHCDPNTRLLAGCPAEECTGVPQDDTQPSMAASARGGNSSTDTEMHLLGEMPVGTSESAGRSSGSLPSLPSVNCLKMLADGVADASRPGGSDRGRPSLPSLQAGLYGLRSASEKDVHGLPATCTDAGVPVYVMLPLDTVSPGHLVLPARKMPEAFTIEFVREWAWKLMP